MQLQLLRIMTSTLSMVQARLLDSSFLIQQRLVSYLTRQITILMHVLLRHTQESLHSSFTRDIRSSTEQTDKGLILLPCELIADNGIELKKCIMKFIELWGLEDGFKDWVNNYCSFCPTLVDRIVPGYPREDAG